MAIQLLVAKVLRDELSLRGIQSLSAEDSEAIAARIFERITELELELAARGFNIPASGDDRPTWRAERHVRLRSAIAGAAGAQGRKLFGSRSRKSRKFSGGRYRRQPTSSVAGWEMRVRAKLGTRRPWRGCRQASRLEFL